MYAYDNAECIVITFYHLNIYYYYYFNDVIIDVVDWRNTYTHTH